MNSARSLLVVCYSRSGNTRRVAMDLSQRLDADIEFIRDKQGAGILGQISGAWRAWRELPAPIGPLQHDPRGYGIVVVGTPVWAWRMTPEVRAYLNMAKGKLRKVAFFVTSGDTDVAQVVPALETVADCTAIAAMGWNTRELADKAVYEAKLTAFVKAIVGEGFSGKAIINR